MTDALSEALMKLSAVKPVRGSSVASTEGVSSAVAVAEVAPAKELEGVTAKPVEAAVLSARSSSPAENAALKPVAAVKAGPGLWGLDEKPGSGAASAATVQAASSLASPVAVRSWIVRIREMRVWVAAGIGLAILFTIVDDLRRRDSFPRLADAAANAGSDVNLDELLHEFETAEPATRPPRRESRPAEPLLETESNVTADYGSSESDMEAVSASADTGSGVVRFTGRIEPLN